MASLRTSAVGGSSSGTADRTVTIVPAVGDVLVVYCCVAANTNDTPTCSDNNGGGTYDRVDVMNFAIAAVNYRLSVFIRTALMANTTSTVITVATGSNSSGAVHVLAISGLSRAGIGIVRSKGSQNNQAAGTAAPALNIAALTANLTIVAHGSADTTTTPPTNWTEAQDTNFANDTVALETATRASGFTGTAITFGAASSTQFCSHALELDSSVVGTSGPSLPKPTAAMSGKRVDTGTIAASLLKPTAAITGLDAKQGTFSTNLLIPTASMPGIVRDAFGALISSLPILTGALAGLSAHHGQAASDLPRPTAAMAGDVRMGVTGTVDAGLPIPMSTMTGLAVHYGTLGGQLLVPAMSATGQKINPGTLTGNLLIVTQAAEGLSEHQGLLTGSLIAPQIASEGQVAHHGPVTISLPILATNAVGDAHPQPAGVLASTLSLPTAGFVGQRVEDGELDGSLPMVSTAMQGATGTGVSGSSAITLLMFNAVLAGQSAHQATLDANLLIPATAMIGQRVATGNYASQLPLMAALFAAYHALQGAFNSSLPLVRAAMVGAHSIPAVFIPGVSDRFVARAEGRKWKAPAVPPLASSLKTKKWKGQEESTEWTAPEDNQWN